MNTKRFAEIDSLRVLASLFVFISHFSYYFLEGNLQHIGNSVAGITGRLGVSIFFAVSGYLVAHTLYQKEILSLFYIKRAVRVLIPYNVAYFFMGFIMVALGAVNISYFSGAPITNIILDTGEYSKLIPVMLGMDGILNIYFDTSSYFLTGEWFIGVILLLYIICPLLFKVINTNLSNALIFMGVSIVFSTCIFHLVKDEITYPFWFFLTRLPELYIGMVLYRYRTVFEFYKKQICIAAISIAVAWMIFSLWISRSAFLADALLPLTPASWFLSIPLVILAFIIVKHISGLHDSPLVYSGAQIAYPFMLVQHAVINVYLPHFPTKEFSVFGYIFVLVTLLMVTIIIARAIKKISSPMERFCLQKLALLYKHKQVNAKDAVIVDKF